MSGDNSFFPPVNDWRAALPQIDSLTLQPSHPFNIPSSYYGSPTNSDSSSSGGNGSHQSLVHSRLSQGQGQARRVGSNLSGQYRAPQGWGGSGTTPLVDDPPYDPRRGGHANTPYAGNGHEHGGSQGFIARDALPHRHGSAEGSPGGSVRSLESECYSEQDTSSPGSAYDYEHSHPRYNNFTRTQYSASRRAGSDRDDASQASLNTESSDRSYFRSNTVEFVPEETGYGQQSPHPQSAARPPSSHHASESSQSIASATVLDVVPPDPGPLLRQMLNIASTVPLNLQAIPDPPAGEKPKQPYPVLVQLAIYGSPRKKLTLQEIYSALEERFDWFKERSKETQWKNSIRHNLSLNKVFRQAPRPITEPGKGKYWMVDLSEGTGNKRQRKRNRRKKDQVAVSGGADRDTSVEDSDEEGEEGVPSRPHSRAFSAAHAPSHKQPSPIKIRGTSSAHSPRTDDASIDPRLRDAETGHTVGEGRVRVSGRRAGSTPPYPSPPPVSLRLPQAQASPAPASPFSNATVSEPPSFSSVGMNVSTGPSGSRSSNPHMSLSSVTQGPSLGGFPGQGQPRFGQPSFGQSSFGQQPAFGQTSFGSASIRNSASNANSNSSRAFMSSASEPVALGPIAASSARTSSRTTHTDRHDRHVTIPKPTPKPGVEYYRDDSGLPRARRVAPAGPSKFAAMEGVIDHGKSDNGSGASTSGDSMGESMEDVGESG